MIPLSIHACQKVKNDNYHLGQLNRPLSHIDIQRNNMVGLFVESHIVHSKTKNESHTWGEEGLRIHTIMSHKD